LSFANRSSVLPLLVPFEFGDEPINIHESVSAMCSVNKGDLPIDIWWTFTDDRSNTTRNSSLFDGVMITKSGNKASVLTIESSQPKHRGNYTCFAKNKAGSSQHSAYLSINGELKHCDFQPAHHTKVLQVLQFVHEVTMMWSILLLAVPQIAPFSFGEDEEINMDEAVAVTCIIIKGDTPIEIWWTLLDDFSHQRNLSSNDGVMITRNNQKVSLLTIESVKARHRGNYTCFAKNKAGIVQHSAFLSVSGD
jgi:Immunoglobulin domain